MQSLNKPTWSPAKTGTLSSAIVSQFRAALFAGQLQSGKFIGSEASLAEEFNVSRMVSRDALRTLEALGIVEIRTGVRGGAWVAMGNAERFSDSLAIQLQLIGLSTEEVLEAQLASVLVAAELAARRCTEEDVVRLKAARDICTGAGSDPETFTAAAMNFMEEVLVTSRNRVMLGEYKALRQVLTPILKVNTTPKIATLVQVSNDQLIEAISHREVAQAGLLMRQRIEQIRRTVVGTSVPGSQGITPFVDLNTSS